MITLKHPYPKTAAECVENGFDWLDETKPNWVDLVNIDDLMMKSTVKCVAGQVFAEEAAEDEASGYDHVYALVASANKTETYGIDAYRTVSALGFSNEFAEFAELEQAWREAITARRSS